MTATSAIERFAEYVAANEDWDDGRAIEHLVTNGVAEDTACDVVRLTPIAFGRTIIDGLGIQLTNKYICFRADGSTSRSGKLDQNDVFQTASANAHGYAQHAAFQVIALSSSEVHAVNQTLNAGSNPADLVIGPVAIFLERPTDSGLRIAHGRITTFAKMVANKNPKPDSPACKKPWWQFW